jgi:hypothetical protein
LWLDPVAWLQAKIPAASAEDMQDPLPSLEAQLAPAPVIIPDSHLALAFELDSLPDSVQGNFWFVAGKSAAIC